MELLQPGFDEFERLAAGHTHVPVAATLVCDELTPLSAFARLSSGASRSFLLESVVGPESVARYSFVGADPVRTLEGDSARIRWHDHPNGQVVEQPAADPLAALEAHLARYRAASLPGLPRFLGGAVGYVAYDAVRYYERLPNAPPDDRGLPDLLFDIYETMVIFDHVRKVAHVVTHADIAHAGGGPERRRAYALAAGRIEALVEQLRAPAVLSVARVSLPAPLLERFSSNLTQAQFEEIVTRCKEYIRAGDIFQVVPAQRLLVETPAAPLNIYRALRVINPSPFMFYLKSPQVVLVGASPEILCRVENGVVTNRPLAGTRRRGATAEEDRRLQAELLADPKERAEHAMLVDLGRNDLARVCIPASVRVADLMSVEYYSHVMHISSTVTGALAPGRTAFDALRAALPVGTVTGAPKIRAMQIIDECEPTRRGPYAGGVGYADFGGNLDLCIALRTLVVQPGEGGIHRAFLQVGAGVVADSEPAREYQETLAKAQSLLAAIRMAEERFAPPTPA